MFNPWSTQFKPFVVVMCEVVQVPQVEICGGIVRVQADGMLKLFLGGSIRSLVQISGAQIVACRIKIGRNLQRLFVMLDGIIRLVMCVRFDSGVEFLDRRPGKQLFQVR